MAAGGNKILYVTFVGLLLLLAGTIAVNFAPLGAAHTWVGLSIAAVKTIIVVVVFMGLHRSAGAARLAAGTGLLWLSFAMLLIMADYLSRGWDEAQGHDLRSSEHPTTYDRVEYSGKPPGTAIRQPSSKP